MKKTGKLSYISRILLCSELSVMAILPCKQNNIHAEESSQVVWNFDYTGSVQTFTASRDGTYQLEVWGAQGGSDNCSKDYTKEQHPGFGGYSTGVINLKKGDVLYVIVGGAGSSVSNAASGGYNGGGNKIEGRVYENPYAGETGGGMTHISTTNNPVSDNGNWNPDGTIIVAGGGGGDDNELDDSGGVLGGNDDGTGGSGGGFHGGAAHDAGSITSTIATQTSGHAQGKGETLSYIYNVKYTADGGAGGGGWYGGYAALNNNSGGSGGSGYIDTSKLTSAHMTGYEVDTSNDTATKTISVHNYSASPVADYAKLGNGYARITDVTQVYGDVNEKITSSLSGNYHLSAYGSSGDIFDKDNGAFVLFDVYCNNNMIDQNVSDYYESYPANDVIKVNNIRTFDSRIKYIGPAEISKYSIDAINFLQFQYTVYPITYDLQGGTISNAPSDYDYLTPRNIPDPIKPGYVFTGWTGWNGNTPQKDVKIPLNYPTSNGADGTVNLKANWEPATYAVMIPTAVSYENMNTGVVDQTASYDVNVKGSIGETDKITVTADASAIFVNDGTNQITATMKQGKNSWSSDEVAGDGTNSKDNIMLSGTVKTADVFKGSITYKAKLN